MLKRWQRDGAYIDDDPFVDDTKYELPDNPNITCKYRGGLLEGMNEPLEIDLRANHARFPDTATADLFAPNNTPAAVASGHWTRTRKVPLPNGEMVWTDEQKAKLKEVVQALLDTVFSQEEVDKAKTSIGSLYTSIKEILPGARTHEQREIEEMETLATHSAIDIKSVFSCFVKAETNRKDVPRIIVNHGSRRCAALACVAFTFEKCLFNNLERASIKNREKCVAITQLLEQFADITGTVFDNDLSSFEYAIHELIKAAESEIIQDVARKLGADVSAVCLGFNEPLFHRVVDERTKICTWEMTYKTTSGAIGNLKIAQFRVIRESGDRLTSSGNWLQNCLAWLCFLCKPGTVLATVKDWMATGGRHMDYISARTGEEHRAVLGFEGDDTLGKTTENELFVEDPITKLTPAEVFFQAYGWAPKMTFLPDTVPYGHVTFVGVQAPIELGQPILYNEMRNVKEKSGVVLSRYRRMAVQVPEFRRLYCTKQYSAMAIPGFEEGPKSRKHPVFQQAVRIFATNCANSFRHYAPAYNFWNCVINDHPYQKVKMNNENKQAMFETAKQVSLRETGTTCDLNNMTDHLEVELLPCEPLAVFERFCEHLAPCTPMEKGLVCSLASLNVYGSELRGYLPESWTCM